jgi:AcrR family transcriptional regulator
LTGRLNHVIELFNHMTKTASLPRPRGRRPAPRRRASRAEPRQETQDRILDAAERLFAERGVDAVSVRSVLAAAGVNVSLAHYHFGGRDGLIEALLRSRLGPITEERRRRLAALAPAATLEDVLRAYHEHPPPEWMERHPAFCRLLGQLEFSPNSRVREIAHDVVREAFAPLGAALASRLPRELAAPRWICRFYFVLGVGSFADLTFPDMVRSARKHFGAQAVLDRRTLTDELVRFCAAGLRASAGEGQP